MGCQGPQPLLGALVSSTQIRVGSLASLAASATILVSRSTTASCLPGGLNDLTGHIYGAGKRALPSLPTTGGPGDVRQRRPFFAQLYV